MIARYHLHMRKLVSLLFAVISTPAFAAPPALTIATKDGKDVPVVEEDMSGIQDRPLVKTRERLNAQYKRDFLFLDKVETKPGETLIGKYTVKGDPLRLTVYEISKEKSADHRTLKVLATKWLKDGETAEFTTEIRKLEEDVFLVTAEKTKSADELDPHLKYMASQDGELLVKGFGTNWNLSQLKFKLSEKKKGAAPKDGDFAKDADWMVANLIDPLWVISIRVIGAE